MATHRAMFISGRGTLILRLGMRGKEMLFVFFLGAVHHFSWGVEGTQHFTLVGEAYVYGIMGGELFESEAGHLDLRDFEII